MRKYLHQLLLVCLSFILCGCEQGGDEGNRNFDQVLVVQVVSPNRVDQFQTSEIVYGRFIPERKNQLSFARSGVIESFSAQVGQKVKAGSLLAELDQEPLISQRARLEKTPEGEKQLAILETQIGQGQLIAPYDCIVAEWLAEEGAIVSPAVSICRLVADAIPVIECHLTNRQASYLEDGLVASFSINGNEYQSQLDQLTPVSTGLTKQATLTVENLPSDFREFGTVVELRLSPKIAKTGYWLPKSAVLQDRNRLWMVYGVHQNKNEEDVLKVHYVDVVYFDNDRVFLTGTELDGIPIVASGTHRIVAGQRVTLESIENSAASRRVEG